MSGQTNQDKLSRKIDERMQRIFREGRSFVEHEDDLVDRRLKWAITISGFLFAAYGATWIAWPDEPLDDPRKTMFVLCIARMFLAVLGYRSALTSATSIEAAHLAIRAVTRKYNNFVKANRRVIENARLPVWKMIGDKPTHLPGFVSSNSLPYGLAGVWSVLFFWDILVLLYMTRYEIGLPGAPFLVLGQIVMMVAAFVLVWVFIQAQDAMKRVEDAGSESNSVHIAKEGSVTRISEDSFEKPMFCE